MKKYILLTLVLLTFNSITLADFSLDPSKVNLYDQNEVDTFNLRLELYNKRNDTIDLFNEIQRLDSMSSFAHRGYGGGSEYAHESTKSTIEKLLLEEKINKIIDKLLKLNAKLELEEFKFFDILFSEESLSKLAPKIKRLTGKDLLVTDKNKYYR